MTLMKKVATILIVFFAPILSYSQNTWMKLLDTPMHEYFCDIYELTNGDIYLGYSKYPANNFLIGSSINMRLNSFGEIIEQSVLDIEDRDVHFRGVIEDNESILAKVHSFHKFSNSRFVKSGIHISLHGGTDKIFRFPAEYDSHGLGHITRTHDKTYLTGAYRKPGNLFYTQYLFVFSPSFDSLNFIEMDVKQTDGFYQLMKPMNNNRLWTFNLLKRRYEIIDDSYNIIGTYPIEPYFTSSFGFKWDTDTSFYFSCKDIRGPNPYTIVVGKQYHPVDTTNRLVKWWNKSDTVDFPAFVQNIDLKHKDTVYVGFTRNLNIQNPLFAHQPSWFVLLQLDSMLNLRWERFYGGDAYYVMGKIISTKDGGCLIGGWRYDYHNNADQQTGIILLKLDNEGLISSVDKPSEFQMRETLIYPNPGGDDMHIRIAVQHPAARFNLFDAQGRPVLEKVLHGPEHLINTSSLNKGTYIFKITSDYGLNESGKWIKY